MKLNNETRIGILVVIVAIIAATLFWKASGLDFRPKGYELMVRFKSIDGVNENSPVTLNGFEVGRVKNIEIIYEKITWVELTLWLDADAQVPKGAEAFVRNMGFLGEKYIGITTGDNPTEFLAAREVLYGREPGSMSKMIADGQKLASNLIEISERVNERLKVNSAAIDNIIKNMDITAKNLTSITNNVDERLNLNATHFDTIMANLNSTSGNLEDMSQDLKDNPWKLLYKPKNMRNY